MTAEPTPQRRERDSTEQIDRGDHGTVLDFDDITVGPFANGFGTTGDGRSFTFRVVGSVLTLSVYRADGLPGAVPGLADVEGVASAKVNDVDLSDERSLVAMVRDMSAHVRPPAGSSGSGLRRVVRIVLDRIVR